MLNDGTVPLSLTLSPAMIIDAHTHLFADEVRRRRKEFCRRDPRFAVLYENPKSRMAGAPELLQAMDRDGVDRSVVCGFPWKDSALCREGNDYLFHCAREHPGRLIPFASLPSDSIRNARKELDLSLSRGFRGIGETAFYGRGMGAGEVRSLAAVLHSLRGRSIPFLLHANEPVGHLYPGKTSLNLNSIYQLLLALPDVIFILAHWGGGFFFYELMPEVARAARRVYYDTAASPFLYDPRIYRLALNIVGPGRILFGSDFPLISPARYFAEMDRIRLPRPVRDKIKGLNAHVLLEAHEF